MTYFNDILESDLDNFLNCKSRERYSSDIRRIKLLNEDFNISLKCIGSYLNGRTGASVHNLKTMKNKLNESTQTNLDSLIKYACSRLTQKMEQRTDLSKTHKENINLLIKKANGIVGKKTVIVRQPFFKGGCS
jgi:hypothetical protein